MDNLERSERTIAKILELLAERGFQRSDISFSDLNLDPEYEAFFDLSVNWLMDEGIIRVSDFATSMGGSGTLLNPVISAYGFALLGQKFYADGATVGTAVKKVSQEGFSYSKAGDLFGGVLGGLVKSLGGG